MVETAIVLPTFLLLVFGLFEMARLGMVAQLLKDAARAGCRTAVVASNSQTDVNTAVQSLLNSGGIKTYTLTTSPSDVTTSKLGDQVTVTVSVAFGDVSWLAYPVVGSSSTNFAGSATMSRERPFGE
jgi:Flp pilus assembly protein TadG